MKTTLKKINDTKYEVVVNIEGTEWTDAQNKAEKKLCEKVEIKGFRKGTAPIEMAKKHINTGDMFNEAINIVLPNAFSFALKEHKLQPFTRPNVAVEKFSTSDLSLKFTIITAPKVTLGNYKGIKIAKKEAKVTDQEIDDSIKDLLKQNAELVVKNATANKGDTVILDFDGYVDGKPFDGGKASNYELKLGSGQFVPGFEDQLVGTKAGDQKDVNVTFPEKYVENLKGKKATFKCLIHEVKEEKIPALNDETIKGLAIEKVTNIDELKAHQKRALENKKKTEVENAYYNELLEKIMADSKADVADEIVNEEMKAMKEDMIRQVEQNGLKWDQYLQITGQKSEDFEKKLKTDALKNIKATLVLNEIMVKENVTVNDDEVKAEMKRLADLYKMDLKKVEEILNKDLGNFKQQIKSKKLHDLLINLNK